MDDLKIENEDENEDEEDWVAASPLCVSVPLWLKRFELGKTFNAQHSAFNTEVLSAARF